MKTPLHKLLIDGAFTSSSVIYTCDMIFIVEI